MEYTPLHNLTDEELLVDVAQKTDATPHEIELAMRLELALHREVDACQPPQKDALKHLFGSS